MDLKSYSRWHDYTRARDEMFKATDTPWAPWFVIRSDDKKRARLNAISHLLRHIPYEDITRGKVKLPKRKNHHGNREPDYPYKFVPELTWPSNQRRDSEPPRSAPQRALGYARKIACRRGQDRVVVVVARAVQPTTVVGRAIADPDERTGPLLQIPGEVLAGHRRRQIATQWQASRDNSLRRQVTLRGAVHRHRIAATQCHLDLARRSSAPRRPRRDGSPPPPHRTPRCAACASSRA